MKHSSAPSASRSLLGTMSRHFVDTLSRDLVPQCLKAWIDFSHDGKFSLPVVKKSAVR